MLNAILDAISVSLGHEFGDGYQIYMEQIEQGWKEPCFFISCLKSSSKHSFEERYFRGNQFCVQYSLQVMRGSRSATPCMRGC